MNNIIPLPQTLRGCMVTLPGPWTTIIYLLQENPWTELYTSVTVALSRSPINVIAVRILESINHILLHPY